MGRVQLFFRPCEVRLAQELEFLAADGRGLERGLGAGGLAEVDDPRPRRRYLDGRRDRRSPERVEHDRWAGAVERAGEVAVECGRRVGSERTRPLEAARVAAGGDDELGAAQLRALNRDAAGGAGGAEDEHAVAGADPRPLEGVPADDSRDAEGDGRRVVDVRVDRHEAVGATVACSASVPSRATPSPSPKT